MIKSEADYHTLNLIFKSHTIHSFLLFCCIRLPSAPIFPIFSYIFRASYFFLYFDPKSFIFPSNSYIFQNAADNNEISRKNHGIVV